MSAGGISPSISFVFHLGSFFTLPMCSGLPFGFFLFYQYILGALTYKKENNLC